MSKQVLRVSCTVQLDHNDSRLILIPDEAGLEELKKARSARMQIDLPVEVELADIPEAPAAVEPEPGIQPVEPKTEIPAPAPTAS